ncbi:MAG: hypothetical protein QM632_05795 [Micrococcaceae bacterium]
MRLGSIQAVDLNIVPIWDEKSIIIKNILAVGFYLLMSGLLALALYFSWKQHFFGVEDYVKKIWHSLTHEIPPNFTNFMENGETSKTGK